MVSRTIGCLTLTKQLTLLMRFYLWGFTIESWRLSQLSPAWPSYPARANSLHISLQNYMKKKVGSARRLTRLAGSPFFDGRVTLLDPMREIQRFANLGHNYLKMVSKPYAIISNKLWHLSFYFGDLYNWWVLASQQKALGPCKCARYFRAMQTYRNYGFS